MSKIEVNTIEPQCGTTLTLGGSGDTVTLASGASQSGFGRTGTVDWQTGSIKTATFTAVNGEGYFCNTSGGAFTVNLPAGTAGAIFAVADYTRTFGSNTLTIAANGSEKIGGYAQDAELTTNGETATFVYVDANEGWININQSETTQTGVPPYITATGGTITYSGNCAIHTFTGPGTFTVNNIAQTPANNALAYMVIAGGGAGGDAGDRGAGGGGAGGFREGRTNPVTPYTASPLAAACSALTASVTSYPITVGAGAAGRSSPCVQGLSGSDSIFSTITSTGGGGGGGESSGSDRDGTSGGSGGGGGKAGGPDGAAGAGNTPPTNPSQGNPGAGGGGPAGTPSAAGGGGGGATAAGVGPPAGNANGGAGATTSISASPVAYAGGGGGAGGSGATPGNTGAGGTGGGGGGGGWPAPDPATPGTANTGGGGGGSGDNSGGGNGGSGIVIIRYKYQ